MTTPSDFKHCCDRTHHLWGNKEDLCQDTLLSCTHPGNELPLAEEQAAFKQSLKDLLLHQALS